MKWVNIFFLLYPFLSFSQGSLSNNIYITYPSESIPQHSFLIDQERVLLKISSKGSLFPQKTIRFSSKIKKDTIYIIKKEKVNQGKGIKLNDNEFVSQFNNTHFYRKSKDVIVHLQSDRLYYAKAFVDSILGDQVVYSVNQKILMSKKDSITLKDILDKQKFKAKKLKHIKGEKAIKSYGILGLNGVIEIKGKFKKCKRK
jgi:hypothetical protein